MAKSSSPVFELAEVSSQRGTVTALSEVSLRVQAGERVALIGPSGAGKSTLLALLNGSLVPSDGQVKIWGENLWALSAPQRRRRQRRIGTVYQQHHLVTRLAVVHNVNAGHLGRWSLGRAALSLVWPQQVEVARQALSQVGMAEQLYARTDRLSGGQQQRVALARVLVQDPAVILADEPTASVDPERGRELMGLLRQRVAAGRTLVVSLHDVELALAYCDRILGLRQGRLQFDAPPERVSTAMLERLYRL